MDMQLITWCAIAVPALVAVAVNFIGTYHRTSHRCRLFEIGEEREEFFVPGDLRSEDEYDFNEE